MDAVFIGRQLIADPEWSKKVLKGRVDDMRPCVACNEGCIGNRVFTLKPSWCAVNALNKWEYRWLDEYSIPKASWRRKVVAVGGGPADLR